jgi:hypothetical protein
MFFFHKSWPLPILFACSRVLKSLRQKHYVLNLMWWLVPTFPSPVSYFYINFDHLSYSKYFKTIKHSNILLSSSPNVWHLIFWHHSSYLEYFKIWKALKYILKIYYVINHIIFDFFIFKNIFNNISDQSWSWKSKSIKYLHLRTDRSNYTWEHEYRKLAQMCMPLSCCHHCASYVPSSARDSNV